MKVRVAVIGTVGKTVVIDTGSPQIGTTLLMPDGSVATLDALKTALGVAKPTTSGSGGVHRLLAGLTLGDDHPQYTRRDILTTDGDLYIRAGGAVTRLGASFNGYVLTLVNGLPAWRLALPVPGPMGEDGPPGEDGRPGPAGITGANGLQGMPGRDGEDGADGNDGPPGAVGTPGPQGQTGPVLFLDAEPGEEGMRGPPGSPGIVNSGGVATLVAGTVTVSSAAVTSNSRILLTSQSDGGVIGFLRISGRTPGVSFTISSGNALDTSVVAYQIFEPS